MLDGEDAGCGLVKRLPDVISSHTPPPGFVFSVPAEMATANMVEREDSKFHIHAMWLQRSSNMIGSTTAFSHIFLKTTLGATYSYVRAHVCHALR